MTAAVSAQIVPASQQSSKWPAHPPEFEPIEAADVDVAGGQASLPTRSDETVDPSSGDLAFWIDRLAALGVRADRQCCPNLTDQLNGALRRPIDAVICHALDTDPAACVLGAWGARHVDEFVAGVALLARVTKASTRLIVLDDHSPSGWWNRLRPAARQAGLKPITIENDYPQADPTLLLYTLLGRRLRPRRLPIEQGVLMLDSVAAVAIGAAAMHGEAMSRVPISVRDHERAESYFITAPIGATVGQILASVAPAAMQAESQRPLIVRSGDVLRDRPIDRGAPLGGTSELVLHICGVPAAVNPQPCVRCGWCYEACPTRVQPANVLEAAQRNDPELAERAGVESCIECGICTYVCPSKLPILAGIRRVRAKT